MTALIDARGLRCPWPALRLARALRDPDLRSIDVMADDPGAERELSSVAAAIGARMIGIERNHFRIER